MTQLELGSCETELDRKFKEHHEKHPEIYELFKKYSLMLFEKGHNKYGAKGIMERIRWHETIEKGNRAFKICNNYTSRYARKLLKEIPELGSFFKIKKLRS